MKRETKEREKIKENDRKRKIWKEMYAAPTFINCERFSATRNINTESQHKDLFWDVTFSVRTINSIC